MVSESCTVVSPLWCGVCGGCLRPSWAMSSRALERVKMRPPCWRAQPLRVAFPACSSATVFCPARRISHSVTCLKMLREQFVWDLERLTVDLTDYRDILRSVTSLRGSVRSLSTLSLLLCFGFLSPVVATMAVLSQPQTVVILVALVISPAS